ncbi:phosphatidylinositol-specific phospholipase C1-like protein [Bowmanella denitrificans]|uniref:Phosphatidylinositol-specific phospholipase C1-like protein n=1 Tax=Bowmanella denitrificans TaxID=366582 RepID=A0ABP3GR76_9ALTE
MKKLTLAFTVIALSACTHTQQSPAKQQLKLNQIQVLGTHNSYSGFVEPKLLAALAKTADSKIAGFMRNMSPEQIAVFKEEHPNPMNFAEGFNYGFTSLTDQLNHGVRGLEIDLHRDPEGGRFMHPAGYAMLTAQGLQQDSLLPHDKTDLQKPGLKVLHMADLDFRSSCNLFTRCLQEMKQWSDANPSHAPIFVMLEAKGKGLDGFPGATEVLRFDQAAYASMDHDIIQVLGRERVITPDDVRGSYHTLEAAVRAHNWPTLANSKGKFVFMLIAAGDTSDLGYYAASRPNLEGRVAFLRSSPGRTYSAFVLMDNAIVRQEDIQALVKQGYLVRTRSDIETYEAKVNDQSRARAAFSSGAQVISTDFYKPGNFYRTDYHVTLPQDAEADFRCNPVNADC